MVEALQVDIAGQEGQPKEGLQLRSEGKQRRPADVIQGLDPDPVACAEQDTLPTIVDDERKHAVEIAEHLLLFVLVQAQQNLGIGILRCKPMSPRLQLRPEIRGIVDLSVVHDPQGPILVAHRLTPAGEIQDAQAVHSQSHLALWIPVLSHIVRPPVADRNVHLRKPLPLLNAGDPHDPAHI